ncbi:hypothetical protein HU200_065467 [Digitaria exilis]|uniref:Uncharacterized protein n=1 Tax=Digitaria exilis TaxID=1010633 RepID=A0A835DXW4_9POAL|nr:hypothetical protein HU200_065467 [Digitaria exilis]
MVYSAFFDDSAEGLEMVHGSRGCFEETANTSITLIEVRVSSDSSGPDGVQSMNPYGPDGIQSIGDNQHTMEVSSYDTMISLGPDEVQSIGEKRIAIEGDMEKFRLKLAAILLESDNNTAIESEDTESNADETIDPNDLGLVITDAIPLHRVKPEPKKLATYFDVWPNSGVTFQNVNCCLTGFLVLELMNSWDGQLFHRCFVRLAITSHYFINVLI